MRALAFAILLAGCGGVEVKAPESLPVAEPDVLEFTTVQPGHGSVAYLDVINEGQAMLVVHRVDGESEWGCFRVPQETELSLPPNAGDRLPVGFLPSQPGQFSGTMTLHTNSLSRPTITVALKASSSP